MFFLKYIFNPLIDLVIPLFEFIIDGIYNQSYNKFYILETIAGIPYSSYLSALYLYQSLGLYPAIELLDLHYKETVNEQYHLMVIEELCGVLHWYEILIIRFLAITYYLLAFILYILCPTSGYYLMEVVEVYAANSYTKFLNKNEKELKSTLASGFSLKYFFSAKGRMVETSEDKNYKPTLYDVFVSIRNDELVHTSDMKLVGNMASLYDKNRGKEIVDTVLKRNF